ncbi:MAG: SufD family Fe-S cluster assembly protein [Puniceicoccales bacterium]|nr:SufD family Fe-S cluster assembly protein [Puniceicoccales bacterium]
MEGVVFLQSLAAVPEEIVPTGDLCLVDGRAGSLDYALRLRIPCTVRLLIHCELFANWRRSIAILLESAGAAVEIFSLVHGSGRQEPTLSLSLRHRAEETVSRCTLQSIGEDHCAVQIRTLVAVDCQAHSCQAQLCSRSLLLSPDSRVQVSPRMDIGSADARCTHGATLGGPDPEQLFYFASRGLDWDRAKELLIAAAAAEILGKIPTAGIGWKCGSHDF